MNKSISFFILAILFGCGQKSKHNAYEIHGVKVKIDSRITNEKEKEIIRTVKNDLGTEGPFYIKNLTEITYDSLSFSYLLTLNSNGTINPTKLHLMKAYTELLSSIMSHK